MAPYFVLLIFWSGWSEQQVGLTLLSFSDIRLQLPNTSSDQVLRLQFSNISTFFSPAAYLHSLPQKAFNENVTYSKRKAVKFVGNKRGCF